MSRSERIVGNLALAAALIAVNSVRASAFIVYWALNRPNPDVRDLLVKARAR